MSLTGERRIYSFTRTRGPWNLGRGRKYLLRINFVLVIIDYFVEMGRIELPSKFETIKIFYKHSLFVFGRPIK